MTCQTRLALLSTAALVVFGGTHTTRAQSAIAFRVIDLGVLADGTYSIAASVNNHGEVVGRADHFDPATGMHIERAFFWKDRNGNGASDPGEMIDLGTLGGRTSRATGINDAGEVVGTSDVVLADGSLGQHAFRWKDVNNNGLADPGEMQDLGASEAYGIGNAGDIAGRDYVLGCEVLLTAGVWSEVPHCGFQYAVRREGNNPVNASGQMVGGYTNGSNTTPYLYDGRTGILQSLGQIFGANLGWANSINDVGQVIGVTAVGAGGFLWQNGHVIDLGANPNVSFMEPTHINNLGQVIGVSYDLGGTGSPVMWQDANGNGVVDPGEMVDVRTLIPAGSLTALGILAINDSSQIAGYGYVGPSSSPHAVLLTPASVTITTDALSDGSVGQPYSAALAGAFGTTPYTWSLAANSAPLPAGLILSAAGLITGTPSVAGTFSVIVQIADAGSPSQSATRALTLRIFPLTLTAFGTATIDGVISPGEWDYASCQSLWVNVPGGGTTPARLCAMNDTQNLYVALRFDRGVADSGNTFSVEFDNDNDGQAENGDDVYLFNPDVGFVDDFRTNKPPCTAGSADAACGFGDADDAGTNDGAGAFVNNGTVSVYEVSHPLNSGDVGHDFALHPGDAVGFWAFVRMIAGSQYPQDFGDTSFPGVRDYGRIIIATAQAPTPVGHNIFVQPADSTTGGTPVTVTFDQVTQSGTTSVTSSPAGPPLPAGFALGTPPTYFEITSTATFTGEATVCLSYAGVSFGGGAPQLFHFDNGVPTNVTSYVDTVNQIICGRVSSLSPFALLVSLNRPPVANAGPNLTVEATSPSGAMVTLDGSGSSDPDGDALAFTWTGLFGSRSGSIVTVAMPLGTSTVTLTVDDGHAHTAAAAVTVTVRDTIAPNVTIATPASVNYAFDQQVLASYACADSGSGIASCTGPVPSGSPFDTSTEGTHTFTLSAVDVTGNVATRSVTYTVTGLAGVMTGDGGIESADGRRHDFEFRIAERHIGNERGRLRYTVKTPKIGKQKARLDLFEATSVGPIAFWHNPAFKPSNGRKPTVDSAVFSGEGLWNGVAGYSFEARASDEGEPGRGRDTFALTIRDGRGNVVAMVRGTLTEGNIQSQRLGGR